MAPKTKSRLVDQPPSASTSEEQEQVEESQEEEEPSEDEEEEETEGEDEEEPKTAPPPEKKSTSHKLLQTPLKPQSSSESGTEDGSGSESESDSGQSQPSPSASDFTVKPSAPVKSPSKPATKRPAQETQKEKDSRRKKPKIDEEDKVSDQKKSSGAATPIRLWSDEDQVAILKGMIEFKAQKGIEPNVDMSAFHDFIKGKLQVEVSKIQVGDKIRRLKKKFMTSVKNGEEPVFSKPHDYLVFELSKKIWGGKGDDNTGTSNGVVKENVNNNTNGKAKKTGVEGKKSSENKRSAKVCNFTKPKEDEKPEEDEKQVNVVREVVKEDIVDQQQDFQSKYPHLAASFRTPDLSDAVNMLKKNMSLIDSDKAQVLEEKWKKLLDEEADLMLKRLDLIREHYKLVVDATRGSN